MREVRMTFGEHLEELRWRIIVSLLYLAVGVTIAFIYGQDLMEVALGPHFQAFSGAQRDRLISRMESDLDSIRAALLEPDEPKLSGKPLVAGGEPLRWEVLFVGTVTRTVLDRKTSSLAQPFEVLGDAVRDLPRSLPAAEREELARAMVQAGQDLAGRLLSEFAPALEVVGRDDVPSRFQRLAARLTELQKGKGASGYLEEVGWGRSFDACLESLEKINRLLRNKQAEVEQLAGRNAIKLDELREWMERSELHSALSHALDDLEGNLRTIENPRSTKIVVISYLESFSSYLKVAVIFGLIITIPFILYEMWKFVGAGLHLNEQKYVVTFVPFSLVLFVAGIVFGYFVMIPVGLRFLAGWGTEDVELNFTLGNYIGLFFTLTLILGLVFQTPLVMLFLGKLGIVGVPAFRRARRIAYFLGLCLAVVLTPPDPFSWSLMALPMAILYEIGIVVCRIMIDNPEPEEST